MYLYSIFIDIYQHPWLPSQDPTPSIPASKCEPSSMTSLTCQRSDQPPTNPTNLHRWTIDISINQGSDPINISRYLYPNPIILLFNNPKPRPTKPILITSLHATMPLSRGPKHHNISSHRYFNPKVTNVAKDSSNIERNGNSIPMITPTKGVSDEGFNLRVPSEQTSI